MLRAVLPYTAAQFARGIIMPNLVPPVTTVEAAEVYRARILAALPPGSDFRPLMTCYLTDAADPGEIERGHAEGVWLAAKLYPAGATTNAHHGVTDIPGLAPVLERMERIGMRVVIAAALLGISLCTPPSPAAAQEGERSSYPRGCNRSWWHGRVCRTAQQTRCGQVQAAPHRA